MVEPLTGVRTGHMAGKSTEGCLKGRGNARPLHSTAHTVQDILMWSELCSQGGAPHAVVGVCVAKGSRRTAG
jgi:hypothetical protein